MKWMYDSGYLFTLYWFNRSFWKYLLEKPNNWLKFWCRVKGHPDGPIWHNHGSEPNMKCFNCKDEL